MSRHPSGRPVRVSAEPRIEPIHRVPSEGPLTPRLRHRRQRIEAIGYLHFSGDPEYDDEDAYARKSTA